MGFGLGLGLGLGRVVARGWQGVCCKGCNEAGRVCGVRWCGLGWRRAFGLLVSWPWA